MSDAPLVSVLILNYRNANQAVRCVQKLREQSIADRCEWIVIDNHSEDDSIGILRNRLHKIERVRIVETPKNAGFGSGYNAGAAHATGKYLLINNPDKLMQEDGLEILSQKLEADESIGIIAPKLIHGDGSRRYSIRAFPTIVDGIIKRTWLRRICRKRLARYLLLERNVDEEQDVDWVVGGCFMISNALFTELGGFDDRFFLFYEDTDICKRCHLANKRVVYTPNVEVSDKKTRLSDGHLWKFLTTRIGRAHLASTWKYFWKWKSA